MKRFLIGVLVFVLVFSVGFAQSSQKQKKNFRLSFSLPHVGGIIFQNYLYSSFDPTDFNRNLNQVGRFSDEIHYDLLFRLLEGAKSWITASIGPAPFGARSSIMARDFSFNQGDVLPFYGNREVNMTRSGFFWRAGVDLRISDSDFWMTLESYQNKGYVVEVKEDFDFAVIDKLESEKLDIGGWLEGYNWYGMEISRKFEERESTIRYGNINFNIMFRWDLSGETDGFFIFPEAGVNLCVLKEKIQGLNREYDYDITMFPEILWSGQPLNRYIGAYRMLRTEEEINNIRYKLNTRFFVGLNMGFRIWKFVNVFSNARIYNRSFTRSFLQKSLLGNFPFDLELNKVVLSGGISYIF